MSNSESSSSSPEPSVQENREPKFVLENIESNGLRHEETKFKITSVRNSDKSQKYTVTRTLEDFLFLDHQLFKSGQKLEGYIILPFPRYLWRNQDNSGSILERFGLKDMPKVFIDTIKPLFYWLQQLLEHPLFGHSGLIEPFLTEKTIPPPGTYNKNYSITKAINEKFYSMKNPPRECDPYFQNEITWAQNANKYSKDAYIEGARLLEERISNAAVLSHLSTAFSLPPSDNTGYNKASFQINLALSKAIDAYSSFFEAETENFRHNMCPVLQFWHSYVESEVSMLEQRTLLLLDYENANRAYDRVKYMKSNEQEDKKRAAERAFEKCSDIARIEVKRFHAARIREFSKSIYEYRNNQLAIAKEHYENLSQAYQNIMDDLKSMDIASS